MKYGSWKSVRLYICKTPGMPLWMALQMMNNRDMANPITSVENIDVGGGFAIPNVRRYFPIIKPRKIEKFPYKVTDCRCKDCRYQRIFKK